MKAALCTLLIFASIGVAVPSMGADVFPGQPRISTAYNKLNSAVLELEKCNREDPKGHVTAVVDLLDVARLNLEQATKNKGSYPSAAIKLIDKTKEVLAKTPLDKARIDEATDLTKEALKKTSQAGGVQH